MGRKLLTLALLALPPAVMAAIVVTTLGANTVAAFCCSVLSFFVSCDGWYFVRLGVWSTREYFEDVIDLPRKHLFAKSALSGRVLLVDIDRNAHCNNARYLRECGFGRRDLWHRNGIWRLLKIYGGNLVVGAQNVRYRRELALGQRYTLETRLICWDNRAFYVEHRFVTVSPLNGQRFVNAIVLVKNNLLGKLSPAKIVERLPDCQKDELTNPPTPNEVVKWIESNDASSKMLRQESSSNNNK